jgi:hypothetical protein
LAPEVGASNQRSKAASVDRTSLSTAMLATGSGFLGWAFSRAQIESFHSCNVYLPSNVVAVVNVPSELDFGGVSCFGGANFVGGRRTYYKTLPNKSSWLQTDKLPYNYM